MILKADYKYERLPKAFFWYLYNCSMPDNPEEKYWIWILAFVALIFAVYPMIKDFTENSEKTITVMLLTLFFSLVLMGAAQLYYTNFLRGRP